VLAGAPSALIPGDTIFFGHGCSEMKVRASSCAAGATVLGHHVADRASFGLLAYGLDGQMTRIIEKPERPTSTQSVTGLCFVDGTAPAQAREARPSARGALEIADLMDGPVRTDAPDVERLGSRLCLVRY
jgi:glucose-1-phosphate thymidylyltransferase